MYRDDVYFITPEQGNIRNCKVPLLKFCPLTILPMNEPTLSSTLFQTAATYGINCARERNSVASVGGNQPKQIGGEMRDWETEGSCLNLELNETCLGQNQHMRRIKEIKYLDMHSWNNRRLRGLAFNQGLELVVLWSK